MIVDAAVYRSGRRLSDIETIDQVSHAADGLDSFAWLGLAQPTQEELLRVLGTFSLHETAIEDAVNAQQRAKLEENGEVITLVIRTIFYDDSKSAISTGEIICFLHKSFVIIVRHGDGASLVSVRNDLESRADFLALGPFAVVHAVLEKIIDEYSKIASELEKDVIQIENEVFSESRNSVSKKIYSLKREVIEYRHAIEPLIMPLQRLMSEGRHNFPVTLRPFFRDVSDQLSRACEHASAMDSLLTAALQADLAQVQVRQNNDVRRISAWVALAAFPTMVAGIYGMNFSEMPELRWSFGYPLVMGSTFSACGLIFYLFKKSKWL